MTRQEFMNKLEELLADISTEERDEAIAYYTSYFEDAGIENEEKVLKELESPQKVAATIKSDLAENTQGGEYTERGYQNGEPEKMGMTAQAAQYHSNNNNAGNGSNAQSNQAQSNYTQAPRKKMSGWTVALIVVALLVTVPVWGGVLGGVIGLIFGVIGVLFGVMCALFGIAVGGIVGGFALLGVSIATIAAGGLTLGLVFIGIGALLIAVGILSLIGLVQYCGRFLPFLIRGIITLFQRILYRGKGCAV